MKTTIFDNIKLSSENNPKDVYIIEQKPSTEPKEFKEPDGIKSNAVVYTISRN